jgi:Flp pilus assembly protein TadG
MRLLRHLNSRTRKQHTRDGATAMETAVVLPVFFLLLFGFVEFGHVFMTIHTLKSAARRAARLGISETATTASVTALANQITSSAIPGSSVTITCQERQRIRHDWRKCVVNQLLSIAQY